MGGCCAYEQTVCMRRRQRLLPLRPRGDDGQLPRASPSLRGVGARGPSHGRPGTGPALGGVPGAQRPGGGHRGSDACRFGGRGRAHRRPSRGHQPACQGETREPRFLLQKCDRAQRDHPVVAQVGRVQLRLPGRCARVASEHIAAHRGRGGEERLGGVAKGARLSDARAERRAHGDAEQIVPRAARLLGAVHRQELWGEQVLVRGLLGLVSRHHGGHGLRRGCPQVLHGPRASGQEEWMEVRGLRPDRPRPQAADDLHGPELVGVATQAISLHRHRCQEQSHEARDVRGLAELAAVSLEQRGGGRGRQAVNVRVAGNCRPPRQGRIFPLRPLHRLRPAKGPGGCRRQSRAVVFARRQSGDRGG
mmetsp:Transcript_79713/g.207860  ORF Transcript_79713/g.207860 Transcript_79713/m.207860 type:complete len:363 (+) Transcript_79713:115-1203(+)